MAYKQYKLFLTELESRSLGSGYHHCQVLVSGYLLKEVAFQANSCAFYGEHTREAASGCFGVQCLCCSLKNYMIWKYYYRKWFVCCKPAVCVGLDVCSRRSVSVAFSGLSYNSRGNLSCFSSVELGVFQQPWELYQVSFLWLH